MAESLGVAASIATLLDLSSKLLRYIMDTKHASDDARRLAVELRSTNKILAMLRDLTQNRSEEDLIRVEGTLQALSGTLTELEKPLLRLESRLDSDKAMKWRATLVWPFHEREAREILAVVERQKTSLGLALQNVQMHVIPFEGARI
ncbi:hypothetical protein PHISP_07993 [Aspergillus sp. HF37]|nr:hypothetical protein PHISP_07993 [Aspergillus sp. HF37]